MWVLDDPLIVPSGLFHQAFPLLPPLALSPPPPHRLSATTFRCHGRTFNDPLMERLHIYHLPADVTGRNERGEAWANAEDEQHRPGEEETHPAGNIKTKSTETTTGRSVRFHSGRDVSLLLPRLDCTKATFGLEGADICVARAEGFG